MDLRSNSVRLSRGVLLGWINILRKEQPHMWDWTPHIHPKLEFMGLTLYVVQSQHFRLMWHFNSHLTHHNIPPLSVRLSSSMIQHKESLALPLEVKSGLWYYSWVKRGSHPVFNYHIGLRAITLSFIDHKRNIWIYSKS